MTVLFIIIIWRSHVMASWEITTPLQGPLNDDCHPPIVSAARATLSLEQERLEKKERQRRPAASSPQIMGEMEEKMEKMVPFFDRNPSFLSLSLTPSRVARSCGYV